MLDEHPAAVPQLAVALSRWLDMTRRNEDAVPGTKSK